MTALHHAASQPLSGRVRLASGWWLWSSSVVPTADLHEPHERWLVFWHGVHRRWKFRVKVDPSWSGTPPVEALAFGVGRLTIQGDSGVEREVFLLPNHLFVHRGRGDVGALLPHDGRSVSELTEGEIETIVKLSRGAGR